jgi:cystathionine beta-synthase
MPKIYDSILQMIGHTPIVRLRGSVPQGRHSFFAKLEYLNPGGSVKDRLALALVEEAEKRGELKPGGTLVEATSGNTGAGLAMIAAIKGYKAIFTMPEKVSEEKRAFLRAYGAQVIVTPNGVEPDDPRSHYSVARAVARETPNAYYTNQYHNPDNFNQHYRTTGPEIWSQMGGDLDVFVGGIGTGGTLSGVGKFLKEQRSDVRVVCNDPYGSILYDLFYHQEVRDPVASYLVEGIGEDMKPDCARFEYIDAFIKVSDKEAFAKTRELVVGDGLLVGPSSGHALVGAIKFSETLKQPSRILVMMPDGGRAYISKTFNEPWLRQSGLLE